MHHLGVWVHVRVDVSPLLQPLDESYVRLGQYHVHTVQIIVHGARGVGVVEARNQRVEFVLASAAQDLLPVQVVAHVVEVVIPLERHVANRVDWHLVLGVALLRGLCAILARLCRLAFCCHGNCPGSHLAILHSRLLTISITLVLLADAAMLVVVVVVLVLVVAILIIVILLVLFSIFTVVFEFLLTLPFLVFILIPILSVHLLAFAFAFVIVIVIVVVTKVHHSVAERVQSRRHELS